MARVNKRAVEIFRWLTCFAEISKTSSPPSVIMALFCSPSYLNYDAPFSSSAIMYPAHSIRSLHGIIVERVV